MGAFSLGRKRKQQQEEEAREKAELAQSQSTHSPEPAPEEKPSMREREPLPSSASDGGEAQSLEGLSAQERHSLVSEDYEGSYWSKVVDIRLCGDFAAIKFTDGEKKIYSERDIKNTALYELYHQLRKEYEPKETYLARDFSVSWRGGRWRGQLYHCTTGWMIALRQMPYRKPDLVQFGFDLESLINISDKTGLVLFAGPTGAGKSTTMAGLMYELQRRDMLGDTVTIEDPIEYLYDDPFIQQREVGVDVESFHAGIHEAMRQAPETIMVGEIRHPQTAEIAVQAGLTGHRVLATIHAESVEEACGRMFALLDDHHDELLPQAIQGIVAQHLVRNREGRILTVYEALDFDRAAKSVLAGGPDSLPRLIHEQFRQRSQTLKDSAMQHLSSGQGDRKDLERWLDD